MKNTALKISTFVAVMLLALTLNAVLVQADPDGIGKYLTINTDGQGFVTATKVNSGAVFLFDESHTQHKVGAGTVLLNATAYGGWEFLEWQGEYLSGTLNPVYFKTEKYAAITAVFREKTYMIKASSSLNGAINPVGDVPVKHGADQTFVFSADTGFHVSSIVVDGSYVSSFANSYTFHDVVAEHDISVIFSENGAATVPSGTDVSVFLEAGAGITFADTEGGVATGEQEDFPENSFVLVWELNYTNSFSGGAQIELHYNDDGLTLEQEENLRLIRGESLEAIFSDVNGDLIVDGTDVSIVANAVNTNQQPNWYESWLDINNDEKVDDVDIHIINTYKGTILQDVTLYVDTILNIIYGNTDHFSIFGIR
jgi:hypothetical protein